MTRVVTAADRAAARVVRQAELARRKAEWDAIRGRATTALQGRYDVLVCDPPWPLRMMRKDVSPTHVLWPYPTLTVEEIISTLEPIITHHAKGDAHFFLWTTHRFLPQAFDVVSALGFTYSCTFVWHKGNGVQPFRLPKFNCEFLLYSRMGKPSFTSQKAFSCAFSAPQGRHSEKPSCIYDTIRRVTEGQRRVDLFGRREIEGFDSWGLEAPKE